MDHKNYYSNQSSMSLVDILNVILLLIKICVGGCLLYVSIYLIFWSVGIIEQFVSHPEDVPLLNAILKSDPTHNVLKVIIQDDSFLIENGLILQWIVLLIVILIIFNVIGRALSAVFKCSFMLFDNLNVNSLEKKKTDIK
ncbi:MAG: hypothetical protein D3923_14665 [Candidatus Electrothrix sp. AR3]|nr:hypothetical protein [Candidatus Electrothrix sp. AR3]